MKPGLVASTVLHASVLSWGLWSFSSPKPLDVTYAEALPVEIVMADVFQGMKGERDAPIAETPAPSPTSKPQNLPMPAENVGDNEADLETPPVPDVKPSKVEPTAAAAAPPPPPAEPEPAPPEPAPMEPAPEPEIAAAPPAAEPPPAETPAPDPIEQAIAEAEPTPELPENVPVPQAKPRPPAPRVAEAQKPDAPAEKPAAEQEPKEVKVAEAKAAEPEFNADEIAALLSKTKTSGGGAQRSNEEASLGSKETTGPQLSRSEIGELQGMIRDQMERCWSPPSGVSEAGSLRISIQMSLDPAGQLQGAPAILEGGGGSSLERVAAEAAVRAVRRCAPYNLPTDKYQAWAEVVLNFDPSEMY